MKYFKGSALVVFFLIAGVCLRMYLVPMPAQAGVPLPKQSGSVAVDNGNIYVLQDGVLYMYRTGTFDEKRGYKFDLMGSTEVGK